MRIDRIGRDAPPAVTHPEYFYGFIGVAVAWQIAFFVIGGDPVRYRALMPVAVIEKLSFAIPVGLLFAQGRVLPSVAVFGAIDLLLGLLFGVAWLTVRRHRTRITTVSCNSDLGIR